MNFRDVNGAVLNFYCVAENGLDFCQFIFVACDKIEGPHGLIISVPKPFTLSSENHAKDWLARDTRTGEPNYSMQESILVGLISCQKTRIVYTVCQRLCARSFQVALQSER